MDRGIFSIEVLVFLYALKVNKINFNLLQLNHPKEVVMLRGNHESRAMTEHFTFRNEVLSKYKSEEVY